MIADLREREEALDPVHSFIVQAPAGSGKTGLLVQRYLRLLGCVERPESVVAMTFTRKAAAEMKERIHDALLAAERGTPVADEYEKRVRDLAAAALAQDRCNGWNLLSDTSRLQIQTIDSLCAMLTRQMPLISGFGGVARVIEDAEELYRLAARGTLRSLAEGAPEDRALLKRLGIYFDNDFVCLEGQIVSMLAQRDQWRFPSEDGHEETKDFCELLNRAEQILINVFRHEATVDFTAITRAAVQVLGSPEQPSDLLYWLDYKIEHLLVDEFQDTSLSQYELINALTAQWSEGDGHTLFLVGDPMQSIYGFRGAEVSLFLRSWAKQRLESVRLRPIALRTSFRSTPEILAWVRESFEPIMSADVGGGVYFRPSEAARSVNGPVPELAAFIQDNGEEEAAAVAEIAKASRGGGSVAILVRSRTHLAAILPALRKNGLPYGAVEIDKLADAQHIEDLISLTRAILHVGDRVSWLACLRAPWCGLTLADLSALAENERDRTILELLSDPEKIHALSPEIRIRAVRIQEALSAAVARAGRTRLRDLVEDAWLLLGGPAVLRESHQKEDVNSYFNLIESLEEGGTIRDFSLLNGRLASLFAKPAKGEDYVQVMTVHQAKGLEFDTVIIPHLEGRTRQSERELLVWNEEIDDNGASAFSLAIQPRKGEKTEDYDAIQRARRSKEEQELKRLFYVGCTRAKNQLYLFGNAKTKKDGAEVSKPSANSFLGQIWNSVEQKFTGVLRRSPVQQSLFPSQEYAPKTILRRIPPAWQMPKPARSVRWQPQFQETTASARKVTYEWVSDTGRHVGTVVHELLKRAIEDRDSVLSPSRIHALAPLIKSELLRLGVPGSDEPVATDRVIRAVTATLESNRGRWILAEHAEARSEWPLGGVIGDQIISGTIDRTFRDEEGRLWIIDFKTSEHQGGRLEAFLQEEQRRYRAQLENYAALIARMTKGPIWLGLYFPLLDAWHEWQYQEYATALEAR